MSAPRAFRVVDVSEGYGSMAFSCLAISATPLATAEKAVNGGTRGNSGKGRLPSRLHSCVVFGPDILKLQTSVRILPEQMYFRLRFSYCA